MSSFRVVRKGSRKGEWTGMVEYGRYSVGSFSDIADEWGHRLWSFLNEAEHVRRMIQKSDDGRPAAEGIAKPLYDRFGDSVKQDRVKQFTGFLIRQVMERHGYRHQRYGVVLRPNPLFSSASLYVRHED